MSAIIFDTETTGLDAPEVVEAAWVFIDVHGVTGEGFNARFCPSKPISLGAMATHHIMDEDLVDFPPSSTFTLPDGVEYLIGHNIDFDWAAIGKPEVKRIDVLAMCRALWPDADSHQQSAMLYLLERGTARASLVGAHSAHADVLTCHKILLHVLAKVAPIESFERLWEKSEAMRVPTKMTFGKHRGELIKNVPRDYKQWLLKQPDVDPYLAKALRA